MLVTCCISTHTRTQNLGTIKCSNLCTEIVEYTAPDEVAVCNLASIALNRFVTSEGKYDFQKLFDVTKVVTRNLNRIIDINYYPVPEVGGVSCTFFILRQHINTACTICVCDGEDNVVLLFSHSYTHRQSTPTCATDLLALESKDWLMPSY